VRGVPASAYGPWAMTPMHDQSAGSHPQPGQGGAHGARDADGNPDSVGKPDAVAKADAVTKAHAIYTPASLSFYDLAVHGLSNRFAWRCPTSNILGLYRRHLSVNHLEAAVGTGRASFSIASAQRSTVLSCSISTRTV
jgi:hypothetical protein